MWNALPVQIANSRKYISVTLLMTFLLSCDDDISQQKNYFLSDDIEISVELTKREEVVVDDKKLNFVYYKLIITNISAKNYCFSIRDINLSINGIGNTSTLIDSLAAHEGHYEPYNLPVGVTIRHLYSVFPEDTLDASIRDFEMVEFGLESDGDCRLP